MILINKLKCIKIETHSCTPLHLFSFLNAHENLAFFKKIFTVFIICQLFKNNERKNHQKIFKKIRILHKQPRTSSITSILSIFFLKTVFIFLVIFFLILSPFLLLLQEKWTRCGLVAFLYFWYFSLLHAAWILVTISML